MTKLEEFLSKEVPKSERHIYELDEDEAFLFRYAKGSSRVLDPIYEYLANKCFGGDNKVKIQDIYEFVYNIWYDWSVEAGRRSFIKTLFYDPLNRKESIGIVEAIEKMIVDIRLKIVHYNSREIKF